MNANTGLLVIMSNVNDLLVTRRFLPTKFPVFVLLEVNRKQHSVQTSLTYFSKNFEELVTRK